MLTTQNLIRPTTVSYLIKASECAGGYIFTNQGAGALVAFTLPTAFVNYSLKFIVQDVFGLSITAGAGDTINGLASLSNTTIGDIINLYCINATERIATVTNQTSGSSGIGTSYASASGNPGGTVGIGAVVNLTGSGASDPNGWIVGGVLTPTVAGIYYLFGSITASGITVAGLELNLRKNAAGGGGFINGVLHTTRTPESTSDTVSLTVHGIADANGTTDFFDMYAMGISAPYVRAGFGAYKL